MLLNRNDLNKMQDQKIHTTTYVPVVCVHLCVHCKELWKAASSLMLCNPLKPTGLTEIHKGLAEVDKEARKRGKEGGYGLK